MKNDEKAYFRHELRTSLNHIMGYGEIIKEDAVDQNRTSLVPTCQKILEKANELRSLIVLFFDSREDQTSSLQKPDKIKTQLYKPIYEIIEAAQSIVSVGFNDEQLKSDAEKILFAANRLIDLADSWVSINTLKMKYEKIETTRLSIAEHVHTSDIPLDRMINSQKSTILIVDDDQMNRHILSRHIERQGHAVSTADNGAVAMEKLRTGSYDLVILDIMMPGVNGYQVLEWMKGEETYRHIPVIMITALDDMESVVRCIEMGAEDYLPKTFDPILLKARINACLEKKRLRDKEMKYVDAILESQRVLAGELAEAAEYVRNLIPAPITEGEILIDWLFIPSAQLGGDCFGYHWIDDDRLSMYLLDVSGHGIGAALLSVSVMNLLRTQALLLADFADPASVLNSLNKTFPMEKQNNMYFTMWYGVYSRKDRSLTFASAGASPALLVPPGNPNDPYAKGVTRLTTPDMIVGVDPDYEYQNETVTIPESSKLYIFTDGIYEIKKNGSVMLDFNEFIRIISLQPHDTTSNLQSILSCIRGLSMNKRFEDDVSMIELFLP